MERYKLLLVDDEEYVRESIVKKIDWDKLGFVVVGQAGNGVEAMELAEQLEPDLLMTDIKMPFMDGLELSRKIKKMLPTIKIAIFSGFDEFEYAKEAITQQIEEYILKPIDSKELTSVLIRMRETMDTEFAHRRDIERLREHYDQSMPLLRQQLLIQLLENRISYRDIEEKAVEYDLEVAAEAYCVAIVHYRYEDTTPDDAKRMLDISLCHLIREVLGDELKGTQNGIGNGRLRYHLIQRLDRIVLLFLLDGQNEAWISDRLNPIFAYCKRLFDISITIGVGNRHTETDHIALCYEEACNALQYRILASQGQCIYIGDIEPGAGDFIMPDIKYSEALLHQIRVGSGEQLKGAVKDLINYLKSMHIYVEQVHVFLLALLAELLRNFQSHGTGDGESITELLQKGISMPFSDMDKLGKWLFDYCDKLRVAVHHERRNSVAKLVDASTNILKERFADSELSLEMVCTELNVSTAYLSTIFKKETGEKFVSYLTKLRMTKATELLAATDQKTYEIAENTGYTDPNYFSYVFKKQFGVTPTKYRSDRMNTGEV